jgi:hypothetical protein
MDEVLGAEAQHRFRRLLRGFAQAGALLALLVVAGCGGSAHPLDGTWNSSITWPQECSVTMTLNVQDDAIGGLAMKTCGTDPVLQSVELVGIATRLNPYVVSVRFPDYVDRAAE